MKKVVFTKEQKRVQKLAALRVCLMELERALRVAQTRYTKLNGDVESPNYDAVAWENAREDIDDIKREINATKKLLS